MGGGKRSKVYMGQVGEGVKNEHKFAGVLIDGPLTRNKHPLVQYCFVPSKLQGLTKNTSRLAKA